MRVKEAIVVEGRYDKAKLASLLEDALIVETGGFAVFHDREKLAYLRLLAQRQGVILLTDSDGAGLVIRGRLSSLLPPGTVKHAYIPDVPGKERRKAAPSKEGKLGVEGMEADVLLEALRRAGAQEGPMTKTPLTKTDFFELGLSGKPDSARLRKMLQKELGLPENLSANGLLQALRGFCKKEELAALIENITEQEESLWPGN